MPRLALKFNKNRSNKRYKLISLQIFPDAKLLNLSKIKLNVKEREKNNRKKHKINALHAAKRLEC